MVAPPMIFDAGHAWLRHPGVLGLPDRRHVRVSETSTPSFGDDGTTNMIRFRKSDARVSMPDANA